MFRPKRQPLLLKWVDFQVKVESLPWRARPEKNPRPKLFLTGTLAEQGTMDDAGRELVIQTFTNRVNAMYPGGNLPDEDRILEQLLEKWSPPFGGSCNSPGGLSAWACWFCNQQTLLPTYSTHLNLTRGTRNLEPNETWDATTSKAWSFFIKNKFQCPEPHAWNVKPGTQRNMGCNNIQSMVILHQEQGPGSACEGSLKNLMDLKHSLLSRNDDLTGYDLKSLRKVIQLAITRVKGGRPLCLAHPDPERAPFKFTGISTER